MMVQCIEAPASVAAHNQTSPQQASHSPITKATDSSDAVRRFIHQLDIDTLNEQFEPSSPQEILAWCVRHLSHGLVQSTSFSLLAVTHMLYEELSHPVPVIFLDTLHLFPETLETAAKAKAFYNLDLHTYQAIGADSAATFAKRYGDKLWEKDVDRFYALTKVEPLERALKDLQVNAWITGRRRDQSETRKHLPIFERTEQGRLKINPLANWTRKEVWAYTHAHSVLYNPLHDQGYTSIGDQPLTTPTAAGEDERAGRWRGTQKTECGIHW
ncbi:MAG: phosphoadenosine phosphosulfate reductase [Cyanobacteria bacterium J06634_5]